VFGPFRVSGFVEIFHLLSISFLLIFVLCTSVVSLIKILYALIRSQPLKNSSVSGIIILLAFVALFPITVLLSPGSFVKNSLPTGSDMKTFVSETWKAEGSCDSFDETFISPRQQMLKDVVEKVLPGKSKAEILELLGPPITGISRFEEEKYDLIYSMGVERDHYINVDSEWLLIWFDEQGTFERYRIVND